MRRIDPRRRRLVALIVAAFAFGLAATPTLSAQEPPPGPDVSQFGGFITSARSNGFQVTYDSPGLLPVGSPIIDVSVPQALATMNTGPVGYGLASFAFPGPLLADLGTAIAVGGQENPIPPYPVRAEAFYPAGPTSASSGEGPATMVADTDFADSRAQAHYAGIQLAPVVHVEGVDTASRTHVDGELIVARARSLTGGVSLLGGLVSVESVQTELVAATDGTTSATDGTTTVVGLRVLGLPATVDADGIRFTDSPAGDVPADGDDEEGGGLEDLGLGPVEDGVDELGLDELGDDADDMIAPLNDLLDEIGAAGDDALQQLFEASGIDIRLVDVAETIDGATASRMAGGLLITLNYDGKNTPVLTELLNLVPSDELPAENLGPIPFSPQALFNLLKEVHIIGINLAPANVEVDATPAFVVDVPPFTPDVTPQTPVPSVAPSTASPSFSDPFTSPTPTLPTPTQRVVSRPASAPGPLAVGVAIPALLFLAVALGAPFFGAGSARLADNTLAGVTHTCPDGLDQPPPAPGDR